MKQLIIILLFILLGFSDVYAQNSRRSVLKVRLVDDSPIVISINDRRFDKAGRSLTIGDLPSGRHRIQVYEYLAYREKKGGHAKLLYSGTIKVRRGSVTDAVINPDRGTMRVRTYDMNNSKDKSNSDGNDNSYDGKSHSNLSQDEVDELQNRVKDRITDTDKLKLTKSVLDKRSYNSTQVRTIMNWLSFESSRLEFAKWAYAGVVDKDNYWKLEDQFGFGSSKEEFNNYLSQNKN